MHLLFVCGMVTYQRLVFCDHLTTFSQDEKQKALIIRRSGQKAQRSSSRVRQRPRRALPRQIDCVSWNNKTSSLKTPAPVVENIARVTCPRSRGKRQILGRKCLTTEHFRIRYCLYIKRGSRAESGNLGCQPKVPFHDVEMWPHHPVANKLTVVDARRASFRC